MLWYNWSLSILRTPFLESRNVLFVNSVLGSLKFWAMHHVKSIIYSWSVMFLCPFVPQERWFLTRFEKKWRRGSEKKNSQGHREIDPMFEYDIWMPYVFFVYTRLKCVDEFPLLELHCVALFLAAGWWIGLDCGEPMVQVIEQHCKCGTIIGEILKCFFPMWVCCVVLVWWQKGPPDESIGIIDGSICNRRRTADWWWNTQVCVWAWTVELTKYSYSFQTKLPEGAAIVALIVSLHKT